MLEITLANVRAHYSRYFATAIAIILAISFTASSVGVVGGIRDKLLLELVGQIQSSDVVVDVESESDRGRINQLYENIKERFPDAKTAVVPIDAMPLTRNDSESWASVSSVLDQGSSTIKLKSGNLPEKDNEVIIDSDLSLSLGAKVGDTVMIGDGLSSSLGEGGSSQEFIVSGISEPLTATSFYVYFTQNKIDEYMKNHELAIRSLAIDNISKKQISSFIDSINNSNFVVYSFDEYKDKVFSENLDFIIIFAVVIVVLPLLAVITAMTVIATTFSVLFAQRKKELALLRVAGASVKQIKRIVLGEVALMGFGASLIGLIIGWIISAFANYAFGVTNSLLSAFGSINLSEVFIILLLGTLVSVIAGYRPASRIAKVTPIVALSPEEPPVVVHKVRKVQAIVGTLLSAGGFVAIYLSLSLDVDTYASERFFATFFSCAISFFGLLILSSLMIPPLSHKVAHILGRGNIKAEIAAENMLRNPSRTGGTAASLILSTTLLVMIISFAGPAVKTLATAVDSRFGFDITLKSRDGSFIDDETIVQRLAMIKGVANTQEMEAVRVDMKATEEVDFDEHAYDDENFEPEVKVHDLKDVLITKEVHFAPLSFDLGDPTSGDSRILFPYSVGILMYDRVEVESAQGILEMETLYENGFESPVVSKATFDSLAQGRQTGVGVVVAQLDELERLISLEEILENIQQEFPDMQIGGGAQGKNSIIRVLYGIYASLFVIFGMAFIVALIGVINTMSLSMVERRRENGLLRAVGLTNKGLLKVLTIESLTVGTITSILGVIFGICYGYIAVEAFPEELDGLSIFDFGPFIILVVAIIMFVAWLSAVIPAKSAAKNKPIEILAQAA